MKILVKKVVILLICVFLGFLFGACTVKKVFIEKVNNISDMAEKYRLLFFMTNQWVRAKQKDKKVSEYLEEKGYHSIAVYGMSYVGLTLVEELKNSDIQVVYGIDKNKDVTYADIEIIHMDEEFKRVDAVVVTAVASFDEIKKQLSKKIECPVISVEQILYEM